MTFSIYHSNCTFDLSHGFLPAQDPLIQLPPEFSAWEALSHQLPKLLMTSQLKKQLLDLPPFPVEKLSSLEEYERAMLIFSYLGHAYVWGEKQPAQTLPAQLAIPWYHIAQKIQRPPVLSYASYALYNWKRLQTNKPIELGNIVLLQNFLAGEDEEWFILIHVDIEAKAIPALMALQPAIAAAKKHDAQALQHSLTAITTALHNMCHTLDRMPERCDPYIYYQRVRPYIHGWKDNPALPNGLLYEGVEAYRDQAQFFKGETGAQSSIIPSLDAALGIQHKNTPLKAHLLEMLDYMPPEHRRFIKMLEQESQIRDFILKQKNQTSLREQYNHCIELIYRFRSTHLKYASHYIDKQKQTSVNNPTQVGTGGTPFMQYLLEHLQETKSHLI